MTVHQVNPAAPLTFSYSTESEAVMEIIRVMKPVIHLYLYLTSVCMPY